MVKMSEVVKKPSTEALKGVSLSLPSRGVDYQEWLPGGQVSIRPPKVSEVKFIAQMTPETYEEDVTRVLEQAVLTPEVRPWDLTNGDRAYLYLWVRRQLHQNYYLKVICPKCAHVDEKYPFDLETVPVKEVPEEYQGPMTLTLPGSESEVTIRLDTGQDERIVQEQLEKKRDRWVVRFACAILEVGGKEMSFEERYAWLDDQPGQDYLFLREFFSWVFHGPDYRYCSLRCRNCGEESRFRLPFRSEFYLPLLPFGDLVGDAVRHGVVRRRGDSAGGPGVGRDGDRGVSLDSQADPEAEGGAKEARGGG